MNALADPQRCRNESNRHCISNSTAIILLLASSIIIQVPALLIHNHALEPIFKQ